MSNELPGYFRQKSQIKRKLDVRDDNSKPSEEEIEVTK